MPSRRELLDIEIFPVLINLGPPPLQTADGIEYKGKLWVVPEWREESGAQGRVLIPVRMIRFDDLDHLSPDPRGGIPFRYVVSTPIPREYFDGRSSGGFFETLEGKNIAFAVRCGRQVGN